MNHPPFVISIQSQVVFGHVGNSVAVFAMQAAGMDVAAIPTVIFSNTPHYPTLRGRALDGKDFADLLLGAQERDLLKRADFILSGYIGSVEVAHQTAEFIALAKSKNPDLIYLCDPVMGDSGPGLYVPEEIAVVMREELLPLADLATPNPFELGWLTQTPIQTLDDLLLAKSRLGLASDAHLIVTGASLKDTTAGMIESVILDETGISSRHPTPHLPIALSGTGDLFAALIIAGLGSKIALPEAVNQAQRLTTLALCRARDLGAKEVVLSDPVFRKALSAMGC